MDDTPSSSEDRTTDSNTGASGCGDDSSPVELSNGTGETTNLSRMDSLHGADSAVETAVLEAVDTTSENKITAYQFAPKPAAIEDDNVLEPEVIVQQYNGRYRRPSPANRARDYHTGSENSSTHIGSIHVGNNYGYTIVNRYEKPENQQGGRGFDFDMGSGNKQQYSAFESAKERRAVYASRKRSVLPMLLDHQEAYKTYTEVMDPEVRSCLEQIARLFVDLDEFFAGMFVHVMLSSDIPKLSRELARIRSEITSRQRKGSSQDDSQGRIYLGDLGHHCEALLKQSKQTKHKSKTTTSLPEFSPTHSDSQSWIEYLEDGFEIPYWKLMLDAFSTSRLRKSTLGGKVIAMALISMRSDIVELRSTLQKVINRAPEREDIEGILSVINKRIKILEGFTDRVALDKRSRDRRLDTDANANDNTEAKTGSSVGNQPSTSDPLLLVTLVLLTLIAAIVPLTLGFKASNETGTTSDADFWYNISSSIFTIMANFVMIIQLTQGSRLSKQYMHVWIWFFLGVVCAIISGTIYPFCNTAWSSVMSFVATVAGFGATLSVAMTVAKPCSDEPLAKKKVN